VVIKRVTAGIAGERFRSLLLGVVESEGFRVAADVP
jgi:hypothetical protein